MIAVRDDGGVAVLVDEPASRVIDDHGARSASRRHEGGERQSYREPNDETHTFSIVTPWADWVLPEAGGARQRITH